MNRKPIQLTIDLDAALKKIAQRQTLNDVHFAVQLVRHALSHQPTRIHINTRGRYFQIRHDGEPIDPVELTLLERIIQKKNPHDVYDALSHLERDHGIALLSACINEANVELRTGDHVIRVSSGTWRTFPAKHPIRGAQIRIQRRAKQARRENRELRFFCEFSDAPIFLNGKNICRVPELTDQILEGKVRQKTGTGWVGIPHRGHLSRIVFLKRGIRFGSQHFVEKGGRIFHAIWNSGRKTFEGNFSSSIRDGRNCFQDSIPSLYETLVGHFDEMDQTQKNRVKSLIFSMGPNNWDSSTENIPIFPSPHGEFDLSIGDLHVLEQKYGVIPFFSPPPPRQAPRFPILKAQDLYFIRTQMNMTPRQVRLRGPEKHQNGGRPIAKSVNALDFTQDSFLAALNAKKGWHFQFTSESASKAFVDDQGIRRVLISPEHSQYQLAQHRYQQDPESIHLLRYKLWGD